jgi:hypothetical protein
MGKIVRMARKNPVIAREAHLALKPLRAKDALVERKPEGGARLKLPLRGSWPFRPPQGATRVFELDEMGLLVWDFCDGKTTLLELIRQFAEHYSLNLREAEVATLTFLKTLARKQLIGMQENTKL